MNEIIVGFLWILLVFMGGVLVQAMMETNEASRELKIARARKESKDRKNAISKD